MKIEENLKLNKVVQLKKSIRIKECN